MNHDYAERRDLLCCEPTRRETTRERSDRTIGLLVVVLVVVRSREKGSEGEEFYDDPHEKLVFAATGRSDLGRLSEYQQNLYRLFLWESLSILTPAGL